MSVIMKRWSIQVTIAPPAPSDTICGYVWLPPAVHSARPSTGHIGSTAPEARPLSVGVERLLPIHDAQMLTYLKLSGLRVGLLINFNSINLRHGLRRLVL